MSIAEYRRAIAQKAPGSPAPPTRRKATACPACERTAALLRLLRALLNDGHDVRLEHRFHPTRRWRFDVALVDVQVAVEIDGGGWVNGAHHRAAGRERDNAKDAAAMALGWRVVRVSWEHVKDGQALETTRAVVRGVRGEQE
jgi:very-short-patch-repair endonuclease